MKAYVVELVYYDYHSFDDVICVELDPEIALKKANGYNLYKYEGNLDIKFSNADYVASDYWSQEKTHIRITEYEISGVMK